jgi:segregation and condensation protein A
MAEYKVQFEVFEGPLDLLLYLIKKEEVDIYEVNLTKLAAQFIEYVDLMRQFDLEVAGEFLVMASTLMYIKSKELLPVDQQTVVEGEEEEGEDPRWELIRQLVEYKKFKDAAAQLQILEERQENIYPRVAPKLEFHAEEEAPKLEVGIFDLLNAVNGILKRFQAKEAATREIYEDKWTVSEKIEFVREQIAARGTVKFSELFAEAANRAEVVCTFLALLELIRLKQLACVQPEPFAEIEIAQAVAPPFQLVAEETPAPAAAAPTEAKPAAVEPEPAVVATEEEDSEDEKNEFDDDEDDEVEFDDDDDDEEEDEDGDADDADETEEQPPK